MTRGADVFIRGRVSPLQSLYIDTRRKAGELAEELHNSVGKYDVIVFKSRGKKYRMTWVDMGEDPARYEIETVQD